MVQILLSGVLGNARGAWWCFDFFGWCFDFSLGDASIFLGWCFDFLGGASIFFLVVLQFFFFLKFSDFF